VDAISTHDPVPAGGEISALLRATDWSATPLGPMEQWHHSLRTIIRVILTSRFAMWMGWGEDLLFFYNEAYRQMTLGVKHPWALGRPAREVWAEIWSEISPRVDQVHMQSPTPLNPLGVKGAGEGGTIPAAAAIAAAIDDALRPFGVKITQVPVTPEYLLDLIEKKS